MTTLDELRAERENIEEEIDRASWQDYYLPATTWKRYWEIKAEMERLILTADD
jgi:hypothetical protein